MYEIFGITEEQGQAIDEALCRIMAPVLGCDPEDISDKAILDRIRGGRKYGLDIRIPDCTENENVRSDQNLFEIRADGNVESLMSRLTD